MSNYKMIKCKSCTMTTTVSN